MDVGGSTRHQVWLILALACLSSAFGIFPSINSRAGALTPHEPIYISYDVGFTGANGVVSGSGTSADPYIIQGWEINATGALDAIKVESTNAHVVLRDLRIWTGGISSRFGLHLWKVSNVTIENLTIERGGSGNVVGIYALESSGILITDSLVANQSLGVHVEDSTNLTIVRNRLAANRWGLYLEDSLTVAIHQNHFVDNAHPATGRGSSNQWDDGYPSGGNFWYDYQGRDGCSGARQDVCPDPDGIGDTPYVREHDFTDRYPRMPPGEPPEPRISLGHQLLSVGVPITFDASSSFDPDGTIIRYLWRFSGASNTSTEAVATRVFTDPGTYPITLTVTDNTFWSRSHTIPLSIREQITFVLYEETEFRLRIPAEWERVERPRTRGVDADLLIIAPPGYGDRVQVLVQSAIDPSVRQGRGYLGRFVNETLDRMDRDFTRVALYVSPSYGVIANRSAISFAVAYDVGLDRHIRRYVLLIDERGERSWLILLDAEGYRYELRNETFQVIVESFEPLTPPPAPSPVAASIAVAAVGGITGLLVVIALRGRKRKGLPR